MDTLLARLLTEMKKRKIKVPELSKLLDVPQDRVYGWKKYGKIAKAEDVALVEKWINNQFDTADQMKSLPIDNYEKALLKALVQSHVKLSATVQNRTIDEVSRELEENTKLFLHLLK